MELQEIFKLVAANGVWAVLFLFMLVYEMKDSRAREKKYQQMITGLSKRLAVVEDIRDEVEKIGESLHISPVIAANAVSSPKAKEN